MAERKSIDYVENGGPLSSMCYTAKGAREEAGQVQAAIS
jgi:hypothetical protein